MNNEQRLKTLRRFGKVKTTIVVDWNAKDGQYMRKYEAYLIPHDRLFWFSDRERYGSTMLRTYADTFAQNRTRYSSIISLYDKFKNRLFSLCSSVEKEK